MNTVEGTLSLSPRYTTFVTKITGSLSLSTTFAVFSGFCFFFYWSMSFYYNPVLCSRTNGYLTHNPKHSEN